MELRRNKMKALEDKPKIFRETCPSCGNRLELHVIGRGSKIPIGYMPTCEHCGFRDWGHVL